MGRRGRGSWRWGVAAAIIAAVVFGLGIILRASGVSTAANVAQLVSLAPLAVGLVGWAASRRGLRDTAAGQRIELAELLRTIADAQGLTGEDLRTLIDGWSGDAVDSYMAGQQLPGWDFVIAFVAVIVGDERWRGELLKRRIRPVWEAVARASATGSAAAAAAGALVPSPDGTGDWLDALRRVTGTRLVTRRALESVNRNELLRSGLAEVVDRLSEAVRLLTAERDALAGQLAARQNSALAQEPDRGTRAELEELRAQLQDTRRRLDTAERLRAATRQRLAESERQRRIAERLKEEAIEQAEQAQQQLAELEQRPAPSAEPVTHSRELSADTADSLMGETDEQVGDEFLRHVDHVLRDEADTIGQLQEELTRRPAAPAEEPPTELIPLGERLVFGSGNGVSDGDPVYVIPDAAPRHFILIRQGDKIRLRDFGYGHGPFINGVPVKDALLGPDDYFDFYQFRYQVSEDGASLEVSRLFPTTLVVNRLYARTRNIVRLTDMSFVLRDHSLLAIIGPSGAGKTALLSALVGELKPENGDLYLAGLPLGSYGSQIRELLGFVPQDVHLPGTFTVRQLLSYAFELRSPGSKGERDLRVVDICDRLEISGQIDQLSGTLSGGQRRLVSIAVELLSLPKLLMLDEPTSGLDADQDREVLLLLRRYAEAGNIVIVTTHSTAHLQLADRVLVMASGGRPVYFGSPRRVLPTLGATTYTDLMRKLKINPEPLAAAYQHGSAVIEARSAVEHMPRRHPGTAIAVIRRVRVKVALRQLWVLIRRQIALICARGSLNRPYSHYPARRFVNILGPLLIAAAGAALVGLASGAAGLGRGYGTKGSTSAATALSLLIALSMLAGQALTYSDIVHDYPIIRREHRTGTLTLPVMAAKWLVFTVVAVLQALLITLIYVALRPPPGYSLLLGPITELFVDLAVMSVAAMTLGLLISAAVSRLEQAIAVVIFVSIAQIALNGIVTNLSGHPGINVVSMLLPSRWGLAAAAASINLQHISPSAYPDALWHHSVSQWALDIAILSALTGAYFLLACRLLSRRLPGYVRP